MVISANKGPYIGFGITQTSSGLVSQYNEERGPSLFDLGQGTLDPRPSFNYRPGSAVGTQLKGLYDQTGLVDYTPFAAGSSLIPSIAPSTGTAPVSGTALTLVPLSSNGAFLTTIIAPETGAPVSVIAVDSTAATLNFGTAGTIAIWNPQAGTGRCMSVITSCTNTNSEVYIVRGRDMYGFKMTENIVGSTTSTGTGTGLKAFKYIQSIVVSTTVSVTSTGVTVAFSDTYGMPIVTNYWGNTTIAISSGGLYSTPLTAFTSAKCLVGSTAAVQTATTGDVRGTYASTQASNGSSANNGSSTILGTMQSTAVRLTILQYLTAPMVAGVTAGVTASGAATMFGPTQFSDF
jgi:hypothetical protein